MKNKRFLITQPMIHGLNGSTLVALELAEYLQSIGASVEVYTYFSDYPAKGFFEAKEIKITTASDNPIYKTSDFDYIWVHSQVIPISIIDSLSDSSDSSHPIFVFHHMSPFDWIPDERPYIYDLEEKLASVSSFIAEETKEEQQGYYTDRVPSLYFPNPAPQAFSKIKRTYRDELKKVLIVSNHPPQELLEARQALQAEGIEVDSFGELSENYSLITPEIISKYDVVITIGKTVQYCLTAGTPVYVYDHFGGSGYLSDNNFEKVFSRNFSGRDCETKKDAQQIVSDLISGYSEATKFHKSQRKHFIKKFSIDNVFPSFIKEVKGRDIEKFDQRYAKAVKSAQESARIRFANGAAHINSAKMLNSAREELEKTKSELKVVSAQLDQEKAEITALRESKSHKIGLLMTYPVRKIKSTIAKGKRG